MTRKDLLNYFEENETEFNNTIEELDNYNGYLNDDRYYYMEELNDFYCNTEPIELLNRVFYGYDEDTSNENSHTEFNPNREYFRYNGYGNLVSADYKDYSGHLDTWFVDNLIENANHLYLDNEIIEMIEAIETTEAEKTA